VVCTHNHADADSTFGWNGVGRHISPQEAITRMMEEIDAMRHDIRGLDENLLLHREAMRALLSSLEHVPEVRRDK